MNMSGWQLEYGKNTFWAFPNMNLGPGEVRVIFCDGISQTDPVQELHTNFSLSKSGGKDCICSTPPIPSSRPMCLTRRWAPMSLTASAKRSPKPTW